MKEVVLVPNIDYLGIRPAADARIGRRGGESQKQGPCSETFLEE
jgi:hypothetical protein